MSQELYEFYLRHTSETVDNPDDPFYQPLRDAAFKAFNQLKKLCDADETTMAKVLRLLLRLKVARKLDNYQRSYRREPRKRLLQQYTPSENRARGKYENFAMEHFPGNTSIADARKWASTMTTKTIYGGILNQISMRRPGNLTKENKIFNGFLRVVFNVTRETNGESTDNALLELIAKLLTSFQIRKKRGTDYLWQDLIKIIRK